MLSKKNYIFLFILTLVVVLIPSRIIATDDTSNSPADTISETQISPTKVESETHELSVTKPFEIRATIQKEQENFRNKMKEQKIQLEEQMKLKRQEFINQLQQKRNEFKDKMEASREAFMKNLQTIKDEHKKEIVTKLDTMMKTVNKKQTDQMLSALIRLSNMLKEMTTKEAAIKTAGADTTAFDSAVTVAQDAIAQAQLAVAAQADKDYAINITTEGALKTSVGSTRSQIESDMKTTRQSVMKAKEALIQVARELAKLRKEHKIGISITITKEPTHEVTATAAVEPTVIVTP